ncbi:MAG: hypothetical protein ACRESJ_19540 [Pseudomonas sp.]|uniref:hypothetical protein n=1 Tax=Pseudomonas sp. TaxID=306 RepID=UPI003D6F15A4
MNYENVLLIGGPKDGVRMAVLEGVSHIRVAALPKSRAALGIPDVPEVVTVAEVVYKREAVRTIKGFNGVVYVIDNGVDALPALIDGYRGGREAFEQMADQRGYNIEQYEGAYVSKITQELYDFWSASPK